MMKGQQLAVNLARAILWSAEGKAAVLLNPGRCVGRRDGRSIVTLILGSSFTCRVRAQQNCRSIQHHAYTYAIVTLSQTWNI